MISACALVMLILAGMGTAPTATASPTSPIADLIDKIARTDASLAALNADVAAKRESVNRAVVDLQGAQTAERLATVAAASAQQALAVTTTKVAAAQREFDDFTRAAYKQGGTGLSMSSYLSEGNPESVIDRASVIDQLARSQRETIDNLTRVRNEQTSKAAAAMATKRQAATATKVAQSRNDSALIAIQSAMKAVGEQQNRRTELVAQRDSTQKALDQLRAATGATPPSGGAASSAPAAAAVGGAAQPAPNPGPGPNMQTPPVNGTEARGAIPAGAASTVNRQAQQAALSAAASTAVNVSLDVAQKVLTALIATIQSTQGDNSSTGGSTGGSSDSGSGDGGSSLTPTITGPAGVEIVVNRAMSQLGVPYAWGGGNANGPTLGIHDGGVADSYGDYNKVGFDCSGLMIYAFAGVGVDLPHYTGYQYTSGPHYPLSEMQRGDMIFYGDNASEHVALYIGNNQMIEAPESGDVVKVSPLRTDGAMPYVVRML